MIYEVENSTLNLHGPYTDLTPQVKIEDLPSHWLPYPKGSEILLRKYTGIELRYFSDSSLTPEKELEMVLDGIQTVGFNKNELTFHDFKYLGLQRRLISLEAENFGLTWYCPKCENTVTSSIKMESLQFDELKIPSLPMNVKLSFGSYKMAPMTVKGYLKMQKTDREIDENQAIDAIKVWFFLMSFHVDDLSQQDSFYKGMISKGTEKDIRILEEVDRRLYHSLMPVDVVCPSVIISDKPNSDCPVKYEELREGKVPELIKYAKKKGLNIPETIAFDETKVVEYIDANLSVYQHTPCEYKSKIKLSSGSENLITPFRESEQSVDNCITFG